jgi:hypothetical protein
MKKDLKENVSMDYTTEIRKKGSEFISMGNFINWGIKLIQWITPFKSPKKWLDEYKIPKEYNPPKDLNGWYQTKELGGMPDPEDNEGREVL